MSTAKDDSENGNSISPKIEEAPVVILSPIETPTPSPLPASSPVPAPSGFTPLVTVVGFHHARGPEVEAWFGAPEGSDPAVDYNWTLLPFMALSDGAHASEEDFSYFTLLRPKTDSTPATSLFGISCTRQLDSTLLLNRPADVTRSTVQKAVVVIADSPQFFGMLRERLSMVTYAWFAQREFTDVEILKGFQESLANEKARGSLQKEAEGGHHIGLSLRELIHTFKSQTLVLLKCCLLQPKMLFFGSRCDRLCMVQFALISLIPGLISKLEDCADPELDSYEATISRPKYLQGNDRASLVSFMGLPLQIFGKGSFLGPYTPLQQLDVLADVGTKSYIVGSTNSLLLQQKDRYSDILINLDENSINITSPSLRSALSLTAADRRWIDYLTQEVHETWDPANPSRPKNMQYAGSEEFIRSQFESYILGLISSVKYYTHAFSDDLDKASHSDSDENPAVDYGMHWVEAWMKTENFRIWHKSTDTSILAMSQPRHPTAGGLTIDDVQRRIADQVKDLHLDERLAQGREVLGRNLAAGREKASNMFSKLYSDVEYIRESQRRRAEDAAKAKAKAASDTASEGRQSGTSAQQPVAVDLAKAQQTAQAVGARASAYVSSWTSWASEKRKQTGGGGGGGWGSAWGKKTTSATKGESKSSGPASPATSSPIDKDYQFVSAPRSRDTSTDDSGGARPTTGVSFSESILSGVSDSPGRPDTAEVREEQERKTRAEDSRRHGEKGEGDGFHTTALTGQADSPAQRASGALHQVSAGDAPPAPTSLPHS